MATLFSSSACLAQSESHSNDRHAHTILQSESTDLAPRLQASYDSFEFSHRNAENLPVAIKGYDVTVLHDQQKWQLGGKSLAALFDGQTYLFSNERHRAIFLAAPLHYVPALGGDCVVTYVEMGTRIAGEAKYGLLYQDRLYFVVGEAQLRLFQEKPARYASADLAMEGVCPVTYIEKQLKVSGIPSIVSNYRGFRYQFASAAERAKFLSNPRRYTNTQLDQNPSPQHKVTENIIPKPARSASTTLLDSVQATEGSSPRVPQSQEPIAHRSDLASARKLPKYSKNTGNQDMTAALPLVKQPAMEGYCPVAIQEQDIWVLGKKNIHVVYDNQLYLFAGQKQLDLFMGKPEQYVPAMGGQCVVSKRDLGKSVSGSIYHAAVYANRMFLLANADQKKAFKTQPEVYEDTDLAFNGQSVVAHREDGKMIDGTTEFQTWYGGLRYRFTNEEEKQKFLEWPEQYAVAKE